MVKRLVLKFKVIVQGVIHTYNGNLSKYTGKRVCACMCYDIY